MKNQWKKITQKIAEKIQSRKYEQICDETKPKIKKSNAFIYNQLFYSKLE